jgi:serine protease inhibitor
MPERNAFLTCLLATGGLIFGTVNRERHEALPKLLKLDGGTMKERIISTANWRGGLIGTLLCFLTCGSQAATPTQQLAAANASFAFKLLQQLAADQPGANIFISPYSVSTAFQMVSTGAAGTTRTQMQQVLGTIDMEQAALNGANKETVGLIDTGNTNFVLSTANAIWYREGTPLESTFIKDNEQFFGAKVEGLNFNKPAAAGIINDWASDETHGKITNIVSSPIDPEIRLFLANAVYFLGTWDSPFDTNLTMDQEFQLIGGGQEEVPMMQQMGPFLYSEGANFQAVCLPYKGGDLAMYVFLPSPESSLAELLGSMSGAAFQQVIQTGFAQEYGFVALPRFDLSCAFDLKPPLEALGMTDAFSDFANFSKMSPLPMHISAATQKAVVDVNEQGTEAAAVTVITVVATATVIPEFEITMDRPFLFVIQDQQAGTILFMGAVYNP